jgi:putative addiction module component (TIGR02574 family)
MMPLANIEADAMKLTENERAQLARKLLDSLPPAEEIDDEVEEAIRRDAELEADASLGVSLDQLRKSVGR